MKVKPNGLLMKVYELVFAKKNRFALCRAFHETPVSCFNFRLFQAFL
jgi:hypothetical protein